MNVYLTQQTQSPRMIHRHRLFPTQRSTKDQSSQPFGAIQKCTTPVQAMTPRNIYTRTQIALGSPQVAVFLAMFRSQEQTTSILLPHPKKDVTLFWNPTTSHYFFSVGRALQDDRCGQPSINWMSVRNFFVYCPAP